MPNSKIKKTLCTSGQVQLVVPGALQLFWRRNHLHLLLCVLGKHWKQSVTLFPFVLFLLIRWQNAKSWNLWSFLSECGAGYNKKINKKIASPLPSCIILLHPEQNKKKDKMQVQIVSLLHPSRGTFSADVPNCKNILHSVAHFIRTWAMLLH